MLESTTSHIGFYRSGLTSPEHRRYITVGRDHLIQDTLEALRKNAGRSTKHHAIFIGLRGMGKTHLLSRIEDEIAADAALASHYLVVRFPEESLRTLSFADFLLGMVEILASICPAEPAWQTLLQRLRSEEDDSKVIDTLVPAIRKSNEEHHRTLIIMLENMGEVFTRQMKNKREVAALRKFLMESHNHCLLLGTATMSFEGLTSVDEPFYDFFDIQHLDHLSEDDSTALVRRTLEWEKREDLLAQWDTLYPRLIALYRMTGGSPRLTVMLASLIARDSVIEVRDQFRKLLDHITPFYQDRLNGLAPQERALLETMATMRDMDKTPASIAARLRKKVTHTSTLLKRLTELRLLRSSTHPKDKRVRLYDISEGFFDLWLYMNVSRGARDRLPFLLDFFASFYPSYLEREKKRSELYSHSIKPEKQGDCLLALDTLSEVGPPPERARSKLILASAYAQTGMDEDASQLLREAVAQPIDRMGGWIVRSAAATPYPDYLTEIQELITLWDDHRSGNLEGFVRRMCEMGDAFTPYAYSKAKLQFLEAHLEEVPVGEDRTLLRIQLGRLHRELAHWEAAEAYLKAALLECEAVTDHQLLSMALNNFALFLQETNRLEEAEEPMQRALKIDEASYGSDHPTVAIRLNNLALLLLATNRLREAEEPMRRALKIDEASYGPEHPAVARDLNNLAQLLQATNRLAEAEEPMRRALKIDEASYGPDHPTVATDLNNLALLLQDTNRLAEAESPMRRALKIDEASYGLDHPDVARDLNNLALMLQDTNRLAEAEEPMRRALKIDEVSYGSDHPAVARDLSNLAQLLQATNRLEEAEAPMRRALKIDEASYGPDHPTVAIRLNNLAQLLKATNRLEEAEEPMRRALKIDEASYGPDHPEVATDLNNLALLLQDTNRLEEAAEPMRRALGILLRFTRTVEHKHPNLDVGVQNYNQLLLDLGKTQEQVQAEIRDLHAEYGVSQPE